MQELAGRLHREDIELEVLFFRLGIPGAYVEYLARPDAVLPDLIVSADLEVFEDQAIFPRWNRSCTGGRLGLLRKVLL